MWKWDWITLLKPSTPIIGLANRKKFSDNFSNGYAFKSVTFSWFRRLGIDDRCCQDDKEQHQIPTKPI